MIPFNLEKALAGDKVVTESGDEATQLTLFKVMNARPLCGVIGKSLFTWTESGKRDGSGDLGCGKDLFMAPKPLRGFLNVYADRNASSHGTVRRANAYAKRINSIRTACIDLSQHNEGEGYDF